MPTNWFPVILLAVVAFSMIVALVEQREARGRRGRIVKAIDRALARIDDPKENHRER